MADYVKIERVARILARAGSDNQHEAAAALSGAYKRMIVDGVTLQDLLSLPEQSLYQDTLVRLIDLILSNQKDLSPPEKRAVYAAYIRLIVEKFTPKKQAEKETEQASTSNREEEARAYRERNNYRANENQYQENDNTYSRENVKTDKQENDKTYSGVNLPKPLIQMWVMMRPLFERGGFVWLIWQEPAIMARLFAASLLWGFGFAVVVLTTAALFHAVTNTSPIYDVPIKLPLSLFMTFGTLWRYRLFVKSA